MLLNKVKVKPCHFEAQVQVAAVACSSARAAGSRVMEDVADQEDPCIAILPTRFLGALTYAL